MPNINVDDFKKQIQDVLKDYSQDVTDELKDEIKKQSRNGLLMLKRKSPKKYGGYAKGWSSKKVFENSQALRIRLFNKTKYQLTHLLEFGHIKWLWGVNKAPERVQPFPHIIPTEEWVQKELTNGLKARLK